MYRTILILLAASIFASCSSEVPDTQKVIVHDIDYSNMLIEQKVERALEVIDSNVPTKKDQAETIRQKCNALDNYIRALKDSLIAASGGEGEDGLPKHMDDLRSVNEIMIKNKAGDTLWTKINDLRTCLLQVSPSDSIPLSTSVWQKPNAGIEEWKKDEFENIPVVAALALLTKEQNDVWSSEFLVLKHILKDAGIREKAQQKNQ